MSRPKFEDEFRTEMQNRVIKPSAKSWVQLQGRLEEGGKTSINKRYWWWGAAAMIAGITTTGILFTNSPGQEPIVVEISTEMSPEKKDGARENRQIGTEQIQIRESEESGMARILPQKNQSSGQEKEKALASGGESENPEPTTGETVVHSEVITQPGRGGLLADVSVGGTQVPEVTDAEIDVLLAKANREISREERIAENLQPDELLRMVETELEQSFRAKVFDILKDGFQKTRTAVVNRNHP